MIEARLFGLWYKMGKVSIDKNDISSKNVLIEDHLYFCTYNNLKFGILNIKAKEIVFVSERIDSISEGNVQQIKDMQVSNSEVYILDSVGTLHLFEKE